MALTYAKNQYTIPRGRVFFNPINNATDEYLGEIYLGNCPSFGISIETEKAEHYSSETGLREKDASVVLEVKRSGSLTCDNMSMSNVALFLSGSTGTITQVAGTVTDESIKVLPGRYYQLGLAPATPVGARNVTGVLVKSGVGATTYVAGTDYNLDLETGRVQIIEGGAIVAGKVQFGYTPVAASFESVKSGGKSELQGALRVVSDNATGGNRDWYLPKVTLTPSGDLALIAEGTDVVAMEFGLEALKPANGEAIYCDGRPVVV